MHRLPGFAPLLVSALTASSAGAAEARTAGPDAGATDPTSDAFGAVVGAHALAAQGKVVPGVTLSAGRGLWWLTLETSLLWLTERDPERRYTFLGSQLGGFFMVRPLRMRRLELEVGLGADAYALWNIHEDEWQVAFAARVAAHVPITSSVALFGTARAYPFSSGGVELGVERDGSNAWPVLFGGGVEWKIR